MSYASDRVAQIRAEQNPPTVTPAPAAVVGDAAKPPSKKARSRKGRALAVAVRRFDKAHAALVAALNDIGLTTRMLSDIHKLVPFAKAQADAKEAK